jgi:hypothetical protein
MIFEDKTKYMLLSLEDAKTIAAINVNAINAGINIGNQALINHVESCKGFDDQHLQEAILYAQAFESGKRAPTPAELDTAQAKYESIEIPIYQKLMYETLVRYLEVSPDLKRDLDSILSNWLYHMKLNIRVLRPYNFDIELVEGGYKLSDSIKSMETGTLPARIRNNGPIYWAATKPITVNDIKPYLE